MGSRIVTIKDIAKALDISVSTVSRALRDTYDVSQETRDKVVEMASRLSYKPNFNATGLVNRSTHNIGVILPAITNYYFSTVITGIQETAYINGFNIILFVTNDSPGRELEIVKNLSLTGLDGVLASISSDSNSCEHFQEMIDDGIPVVFFDRVASTIHASKVVQDDFNGAFEAVEHLIQNGYRKIAHVAGPKGLSFTEQRLRGYKAALEKHGLLLNEQWIIHSGFSQTCGYEDIEKLWDLEDRPDAIFAVNDRKAIGCILALKERGVVIGKEVGVIGFTGDPVSAIITPTLSTIAEPAFEIGKLSCELLLKHIQKKKMAVQEIILPGKLIVRESSSRNGLSQTSPVFA